MSELISEEVPAALAGERLDRIVALIGDISRSDATKTVKAGGVTVDGTTAPSGKVRLGAGQIVTVDPAMFPTTELPGPDPSVEFGVIHEDDDVIVVDKPPGLVVHPGAGNDSGTLANGLLARFPELEHVGDRMRPGIVHRLDAGSSGLLVVARTNESVDRLIEQFADHSATRVYDAMVWGVPDAPHGIIDAPLGRSRSDPLRMAVVADGRPSRTDYQVVGKYSSPAVVSRLECRLETGRTHQIRVHLSSINHPLLGDPTYGQRRPNLGLKRPFLHAAELQFRHPATGERVTFHSPLAPDLQAWLDKAEV
ncbi:RluA family pseudouridine synthase [Ilumatobacter coccineus]|uniref:Pseudouridine synthase n=1 Tax=Ilumatobacter coccineus (strain NBRC 103263 / KCTC 29153 / YM16-304) TaxID=1313172 RepID=A0A6C7E8C2_ILUCY|nr:RluA family pseudouridine synthase [Ilumatobacter coccineus]BAN02272.1 pseudouridine synthase RluD [Ilumatobacter coccineus YM16-304]